MILRGVYFYQIYVWRGAHLYQICVCRMPCWIVQRGQPQYFKGLENPILVKVNHAINQIYNLTGLLVQVELPGAAISYMKTNLGH